MRLSQYSSVAAQNWGLTWVYRLPGLLEPEFRSEI